MDTLLLPKRLVREATLMGLTLDSQHGQRTGWLVVGINNKRVRLRIKQRDLITKILGMKLGTTTKVVIHKIPNTPAQLMALA